MSLRRIELGIVVAKRALRGPWASHAWLPVAALPAAPPLAPWTRLPGDEETYYAGPAEAPLHLRATGHYRDNLGSGAPSVWVVLRPTGDEVELVSVTVDPYEGEALAEAIGDVVEPVPMPSDIQTQLQAFIDEFHVEQTFFKRKRDRADPEALAHRGRAAPVPEDDE